MKRMKLFAGIDLSDAVREACASVAHRLEAGGLAARFESLEKLHITLAFLGWVDPERFELVRDALQNAANGSSAFQLILNKIGAFPNERRPRVFWIGPSEQGADFRAVAERVRRAYEKLGFTFDKPAVAHVTIARVKGGHAHLPQVGIRPMKLGAGELTLFESIAATHTTRYEVRARFPMKGAS